MERKLAHIETIIAIEDIEGADRIQIAKILAWQVIVRKNEFKVGDQCVFFEIDSVLKRERWNDFLFKHPEDITYRLKTCKMRKKLSQGLALPLSILPQNTYNVGDDVTELLGIVKYEAPIPVCLAGQVRGGYPGVAPKSDELRLQSFPDVLKELNGKEVYWSVKMDGTSSSFMNIDGDIHVCSRNLSLLETEGNTYWKMFRKYDLENVLKDAGSFSISGEICGLSIQKNRMGLKDHELYVFSIYNIKSGCFLNFDDFKTFCSKYHLTTVPIEKVEVFNYDSVEVLIEMAKTSKYPNGSNGEGFVIRPVVECHSEVLDGRLSVKIINNNYLLEEKD